MSESKTKAFISYAREDYPDALQLYRDLKQKGVDPWLDKESILPGVRWKEAVNSAIRDSRYFIALLSSNSVSKKGFVQKEMHDAIKVLDEYPDSDIFIIPARLDECFPSHTKLHELQWVDLFPSWEEGLLKILNAMQIGTEDSFYDTVKTLHEGRTWIFESGVDQDQRIFLNEVARNAIRYTVKSIDAEFQYRYSVKDKSKARRAQIYIQYHVPDHGWPDSRSQSIIPTNSEWKSLVFTVTHSKIKDAWLTFTLLDGGQTLEVRNLSTLLTVTSRTQ